MKRIIFLMILITMISCNKSNKTMNNESITGKVTRIRIAPNSVDFTITLKDSIGGLHEINTKYITFNVGDTTTLKID